MQVKEGVNFDGIQPVMLRAMAEIDPIMRPTGEFCVTSALDGKHGPNSFHYVGCAFDLRTRHLGSKEKVEELARKIRGVLGDHYDVVVEKDHIHIEVSPHWVSKNGDPRRID